MLKLIAYVLVFVVALAIPWFAYGDARCVIGECRIVKGDCGGGGILGQHREAQ